MLPITIIVSVKNEEKNLPHCLKLLSDFEEVIVLDSNSTDRTPKIVEEFGYKLVNFNWNGQFPKKRNWALRNLTLRNEWVLFLDADEQITPEFVKEVSLKIKNHSYSGLWIHYQNYFMGKKLVYGDKMKKLAMFKKDSGEYERISEDSWSHLDMEVHEHPVLSGKIGSVSSPLIHNDYKGLEKYIERHNLYSSWEAKRYLQLKNNFTNLTRRQKIKYNLLETGLLPYIYFLGAYIFKLGFLDGLEGYYLAQYKKQYFFQIQTKIKELKRQVKN